jgi:Stealth protein CR2, conserved region 2/Stealth protein CR1, conserved region 1
LQGVHFLLKRRALSASAQSVLSSMLDSTSASPIDVVYLWVNGSDPQWRAKRQAAAVAQGQQASQALAIYGDVEGRYRDNDELRYSLRALEQFFPDHGHIYLVTDAQTPHWLAQHPGLTVVDHRDIIPATALPLFDSGNIESYIHRISGLSERYFYLNDDVFFSAPVHASDWFWHDGSQHGIYTAWSDEPSVSDEPARSDATALENASRLSKQWLDQALAQVSPDALHRIDPLYQHTFRTFAHAPRPMLKSILLHLEAAAPELFSAMRSTVFRTWDKPTLVSDFVLRWALAHRIAKIKHYPHAYIATGNPQAASQLASLQNGTPLSFFCINDTTDDAAGHDPRLFQVRQSLGSLFPVRSVFESLVNGQHSQRSLG